MLNPLTAPSSKYLDLKRKAQRPTRTVLYARRLHRIAMQRAFFGIAASANVLMKMATTAVIFGTFAASTTDLATTIHD
jgi:hypothetical protein